MKVSFTGTQKGMTLRQRQELSCWLEEHSLSEPIVAFVHGACIGADDEADRIAAAMGIHRIVYPTMNAAKQIPVATLRLRGPVTIMNYGSPVRNPLSRNPSIVAFGDWLLAAPRQPQMIVRSGTWATVRIAQRLKKPLVIFTP